MTAKAYGMDYCNTYHCSGDCGLPHNSKEMAEYKKTAQTPAQRKAAERMRKRQAGLEEVRGIYATQTDHPKIKAYAAKLASKRSAG